MVPRMLVLLLISFVSLVGPVFAGGPPVPPPPGDILVVDILDSETLAPLPSGAYPWTFLQLARVDGGFAFLASTDCWVTPKQACANARGRAKFRGSFPAGTYQIVANANGHEQEVFTFAHGGGSAHLSFIGLVPKPITVQPDYITPFIPSAGGVLEYTFRVVDRSRNSVPRRFTAYTTFNGSGVSQQWLNPIPVRNPIHNGVVDDNSVTINGTINVPADVPDGGFICVSMQVSEQGRPFNGIDQTATCTRKGDPPPPRAGE